MKLLIVDDNDKMRAMLRSFFGSEFDEINEYEDGEGALQVYESFKPDWVFMDIEMKKVDGITASKEILKSYPDAKIIVVTYHNEKELKETAISAGVYDYVSKENIFDIYNILNKFNMENE